VFNPEREFRDNELWGDAIIGVEESNNKMLAAVLSKEGWKLPRI
jgi:hypothetical protein